MFKDSPAFSGFSVNSLKEAQKFYEEVLGLSVERTGQDMLLHLANGTTVFLYEKEDHTPATFTILNFPVADIDEAVQALTDKGVTFEQYEGITGDDGIARGIAAHRGPDIAWFKDPAGNILSVLQKA